ncbi:MAG: N-6 DNA methylase [Thermoleophilia bacterium]|nr:N-6 DNA methylase [Thermoleophilia bacterium]
MGALETYLSDLRDIKLSGEGVSELSYYPALRQLLEEIGSGLKPKVRCFMNLKDHGAGLPDGGLFTADQVRRGTLGGQKPARGAIEVKPPSHDAGTVAMTGQVLGYLETYRQVLVTTLRQFLLLGFDESGRPTVLERYSLAPTEAEFWALANHPRTADKEQGERLSEFLKRVLLSGATLASPQDLAWFLASYAREARLLVELAELPALDAVRTSLEDTLGVKFEGEKGEHFFRSTLVQTLFYGLFASWVIWSHDHEPGDGARFDWKTAAWTLRVPVVRALFEQIATPSRLGSLGLAPLLSLAAAALNRVDRGAFFARFEQHHAVQYFYEPFLQAFDPELRKELGVWYTPPEIVEYMVARVDVVLREELGVPDGLADPRVYVLDPCCGTGAYLVEVLEKIAQTLDEKGADALLAGDVKKAALERVFGFEILPAPFVIAHMQLGLLLQNMHLPLGDHERAGVFLTNALTGWESPHGHQQVLALPELEAERDAAEKVKQELPILVILGNPPYNGFAGTSTEEEGGLVEPYKEGLVKDWGIRKFNLDDLYVRFFRVAERRIAEMTGSGVVCFISNFSYLSDPSYVAMRKGFLEQFEKIWIDCLNGDSRETGKKTPDGKPDPSVFSTEANREGIRLGTAIGLMAKQSAPAPITGSVLFRQFWGVTKRADLLGSVRGAEDCPPYVSSAPTAANRFSFRPGTVQSGYLMWPRIVDLCSASPISGLQEMRRGSLMDIDRDSLEARMRTYLDPSTTLDMLRVVAPGLTMPAGAFDPTVARQKILRDEVFEANRVCRYSLYPMDASALSPKRLYSVRPSRG